MGNLILGLKILFIIGAGFILNKGLARLANSLKEREILDESTSIILREVGKWLLLILTALLVFHEFGIEVSRILTALSAMLVLLAVAFVAMWSILSNILCAVLLLFFSPFRFGDEIEIKEPDKEHGIRGKVVGLSLFYTTLEKPESNIDDDDVKMIIRIPNVMFFQRIITCYEGKDTQHLKLNVLHHTDDQQY